MTVVACSSGGGGGRRFTTSKAEAAKWRAIYAKKPPGDTGKKTSPPAVLARLDATKGIVVSDALEGKEAVVAFAAGKIEDYVLRLGDQLCVIGENGAGKSLFWQALSGKVHVLPPGMERKEQEEEQAQGVQSQEVQAKGGKRRGAGGGEDGEQKRFMFMSFSMHGQFLAEHKDRVVADVLGGSSDPLARRLIVQLGLYPLW